MRKNSRSREAKDGRSGIGQRCVARATDCTVHCIRVLVVVVFEREMWQQGLETVWVSASPLQTVRLSRAGPEFKPD